jgi:endonuclease III
MYRWNLTNGKNVVQIEKDAKAFVPEEKWKLTPASQFGTASI